MTEFTGDKSTKAIIKALDILRVLEEHPQGLMLIKIANKLNLPKSTTHRILQTLVASQIVKENSTIDGLYQLGIGTLRLSRSFLDGFNLVREAQPFLEEIHEQTHETVHLGIFDSSYNWVVYLDKVDTPYAVRLASRIGQVVPVHCTSLGKAMLSYLPEDKIKAIFQNYEFRKYSPKTIVNFDKLIRNLQICRQQKIALDNEEHETGVICYGAAIVNNENTPMAAMSVSTPKERITPEQRQIIIAALLASAKKFSQLIKDFPSKEMAF